MRNKFYLNGIIKKYNKISFEYSVEGEWKEVFNFDEMFFCEYSEDICSVPDSIACIPLISNILPIVWVYDAEIIVPECDKEFFDNIYYIKKGYMDMYPQLTFKGNVIVKSLVNNKSIDSGFSLAFFSGGVDSNNTLVTHITEKPKLLSVWGSDITFEDVDGWKKVVNCIKTSADFYNLSYVFVKSNFRRFINYDLLEKKIEQVDDNWWHGFQHGIGLISISFPYAFTQNISKIYFASTYDEKEKGNYTCASDPTIDNWMRCAGIRTIHDGYYLTRQEKIHNIVEYSKNNNVKIPLRVCWESSGGSNCCNCEKCWRTIFELLAEDENPKEYGFRYSLKQIMRTRFLYRKIMDFPYYTYKFYEDAQKEIRKNNITLPFGIKWMGKAKYEQFNYKPIWFFVLKKVKNAFFKLYRR